MTSRIPFPDPTTENPATNWDTIQRVLDLDLVRTVFLHGPPGVGKTYAAYHHGRIDGGVEAITLTEDTPAAELRGHFVPRGNEFVWHDGPFTTAMRRGSRLVVNEISRGSSDVLTLLYPVLEAPDTARLTLPNNETVRPAEGFHVVCTDNEPPEGLPEALQDRFQCTFEVTEPHPSALAALQEPFRTAAQRSLALEEGRRVGLRGWLSLQALAPELGLATACRCVFGKERGPLIHDALALAGTEVRSKPKNGGAS